MPPLPEDEEKSEGVLGWLHSVARSHVDVALKHPIKLIANALGSPPRDVIDQAHAAGVPVAALAGSAKHALRHAENGVDIVVAQGHEAGGHTGEIGSMVLWPEIVDALGGKAPVLAAGGIGTGRQVAAALALGAQGVWMGSAFLTSAEYDLGVRQDSGVSTIQQAMLDATSSDTVRRKIYTGKPARLLKSRWTDAWDAENAPDPLPMPLQNILVSEAHQRMNESSDPTAVAMPVGQIVGRMNEIRPVADIIGEISEASSQQANGLDQVNAAIMQMDGVTQQNAAMAEETSSVAVTMKNQARGLTDLIAVFKVEGNTAPNVEIRPTPKASPTAAPIKQRKAQRPAASAPARKVSGSDTVWQEF